MSQAKAGGRSPGGSSGTHAAAATWRVSATLAAAIGLLAVTASLGAGPASDAASAAATLVKFKVLKVADITRIARGEVVARSVDTVEDCEMAVAGGVRVRVPVAFFLQRFGETTGFLEQTDLRLGGRFGNPPQLSDLHDLTLEPGEIEGLRGCRPGSCVLKLSADTMTRLRTGINWAGPDVAAQANGIWRQVALESLQSYIRGGLAALPSYDDTRPPRHPDEAFRRLMEHSPYLRECAPDLYQYLDTFPSRYLEGAESVYSWSKTSFGLRPLLSLSHGVIYKPASSEAAEVFVAGKSIYSNHYVEASLGLTILVDRSMPGERPALDVFYVNRHRVDALGGIFGALKRVTLRRRQRSALEKHLTALRTRLEAEYAVSRTTGAAASDGIAVTWQPGATLPTPKFGRFPSSPPDRSGRPPAGRR